MRAVWITTTLAFVAIVYSLTAAAQLSSRGPTKVAFLSGNRVLSSSPDLRAALTRFQATQRQKLTELQAKQRALQETRTKTALAPTAAARAELIKQELQQQAELERLTTETQTEMQASQRETQALLQSHLKPVLDDVAKGQGIEVVLNSDVAVFWGSAQLDITAAVIERLNAAKPPPAPKQ